MRRETTNLSRVPKSRVSCQNILPYEEQRVDKIFSGLPADLPRLGWHPALLLCRQALVEQMDDYRPQPLHDLGRLLLPSDEEESG